MITLDQLLASRDARVEHQRKLAENFPRASLICFTVMLPGPVKRDARSLTVARAGVKAIRAAFHILYEEERDLETGFEAYFVVDVPVPEAKRICCGIEDSHPLGRLMDIDVLRSPIESGMTCPVSRTEIGLPERSCLLCEKPARECMRAHNHSPQEIQDTIDRMVQDAKELLRD